MSFVIIKFVSWRVKVKRLSTALAIAIICMFGLIGAVEAQEKAPGIVILKGNPLGGVKFDHAAHVKLVADKCETCHHASKPEKALKTAHENCQTCHTKTVAAPMKTTSKLAFHDNLGKKGVCIECHTKGAAAGKKAPLKCVECHVKSNV